MANATLKYAVWRLTETIYHLCNINTHIKRFMLDYINFMMTYLSMTSSECCEISLNVNLLTDLKHYIHFMHINHHYDCLNRVAFDLGQTAFINCRMQAFPAPRFDWTFGNSILSNDRR